jgi:hypothetical protein
VACPSVPCRRVCTVYRQVPRRISSGTCSALRVGCWMLHDARSQSHGVSCPSPVPILHVVCCMPSLQSDAAPSHPRRRRRIAIERLCGQGMRGVLACVRACVRARLRACGRAGSKCDGVTLRVGRACVGMRCMRDGAASQRCNVRRDVVRACVRLASKRYGVSLRFAVRA